MIFIRFSLFYIHTAFFCIKSKQEHLNFIKRNKKISIFGRISKKVFLNLVVIVFETDRFDRKHTNQYASS